MATALSIDFDEKISLPPLQLIDAKFFVPRFIEKPQDPIVDTLKLNASISNAGSHFRLDRIPLGSSPIREQRSASQVQLPEESVWEEDALQLATRRRSDRIHSWDNLRQNIPSKSSSGCFLSEQDDIVYAAASHRALPILQNSKTVVQYIPLQDLLKNMKLTLLGFSSELHEWNPVRERFCDIGLSQEIRKRLIIEGKGELVSSDFVSRFIQIGTLLRRLETLVEQLRSKFNIGPTMHAFAHALSTCLIQIRRSLASGPPAEDQLCKRQLTLNSIFMYYDHHLETLIALASLCKRDRVELSPENYESIPSSPQVLLSLIYEHLLNHIEHQSSRSVNATIAFILTRASTEYFKEVSRTIGFSHHTSSPGGEDSLPGYPTFFPSELVDALPIAQKSLKLLWIAQPNHPMLKSSSSNAVRWFWTPEDMLAAVNNHKTMLADHGMSANSTRRSLPADPLENSLPIIAEFRIFDLEPGQLFGQSCFDMTYTSAPTLALETFIERFPSSFPPIAPTLPHVTSLVLKPLLLHATMLSTTLLSLFLSLPPPLDIHSHLQLLRSYLLLMSPSFRRRLSAVLFSDSGNFDADVVTSNPSAFGFLRHGTQKADLQRKTWAVGLAPALFQRATWPPVDTDLSYFLRTVILDSFEVKLNDDSARRSRVEEIENRLGFAIRDPGTNAWSNPLHVEALDFLYMEYKPPQPLDVIITPDVISKYQRVFSFLLRILRVQHAIHAVYRMSTSEDPCIFVTLASARKMVLHFRFMAQSFISNLIGYVYDTAIAGNLDPFLAELKGTAIHPDTTHADFSDVFTLAEAHSQIMDSVLTACLLRGSQKIAGGTLRDALELVLDFAVLIGDLYRGRLEEYQAASVLERLYLQFQKKMAYLIEILSSTVDKNVSLRASLEIPHPAGAKASRKSVGGMEALSHLLIRLDLGEFWLQAGKV
ncbi:gamma-tubulin complex, DGRIP91/SPC98 component protein [Lentinula raphanica]|uniref:Spindle pole body component n=1 Tax=Lentinula raphanica TaxID=153919 RepID=A0AA38P8B9_9AGAR|nr:gamma-tubulin complex, DGRIP91/SPC98 component protein [Lentinula raphanica]KAJ3838016.1 gamma-tubulin complex, DGRIP91/SPC98 component protein [Lentinula raphanica]